MTASSAMPTATDARPVLALRVGVTGHRDLSGADLAKLTEVIDGILADGETALRRVRHDQEAAALYGEAPPVLRIVSALAEGADRLVAEIALKRGDWVLAAPLPFPADVYRIDFPGSVDAFERLRLLAGDEVIELDGDRAHQDAAYLEAGLCMLRHSDLVIAIYDREHVNKPGGTWDVMQEAARFGLPLIVVDARPPHAATVGLAQTRTCTTHWIDAEIRTLMVPQWPKCRRLHHLAVLTYLTGERVTESGEPPDFLYKGPFAVPLPVFGNIFPGIVRLLAGPRPPPKPPADLPLPTTSGHPAATSLYLHYQRADALAVHYSKVHRSGFVMIYLLAAFALIFAALGQFLRGSGYAWIATAAELATLAAVFSIVGFERRLRWRERWLDYRLLAEELRQADILAQIGRCPPHSAISRIAEEQPENAWVAWLVRAILRSVGVVGARYDSGHLAVVRDYLADVRLRDQIHYHEDTRKRNETADKRLRQFSIWLFWSTVVVVVVELATVALDRFFGWKVELPRLGLLAVALPALATAGFGIRNQAEFELVVGRSDRLGARLTKQAQAIRELTGAALTSVALGQAALKAAKIMRGDTADWAAIFEVKESEAP